MSARDASDVQSFRTFCHISEYGEQGYANLHRMIACSDPLYLWAPSTQLLRGRDCRVSEKEFTKLVEGGRVRIVARDWWISDRRKRDSHRWEGARWNEDVDPSIAKIADEDSSAPLGERRVLIAGEETGEQDARNLIAENPALIEDLYAALHSPEVTRHIPKGVKETVERYPDDPETVAIHILRDAYNHGDALEITAPRSPFMLGEKDGVFFSILHRIMQGRNLPGSQSAQAGLQPDTPESLPPDQLVQLTDDVLQLLQALERGHRKSLSGFLRSAGHLDLVAWLNQQCIAAATATNGYEKGGALRDIRAALERGVVHDSVKDVFGNGGTVLTGLGLAATGADVAHGATLSAYGWLQVGLGLIPAGRQGLQALGILPADYSGAQWPFLYAFGTAPSLKGATVRRQRTLRRALDSLTADH